MESAAGINQGGIQDSLMIRIAEDITTATGLIDNGDLAKADTILDAIKSYGDVFPEIDFQLTRLYVASFEVSERKQPMYIELAVRHLKWAAENERPGVGVQANEILSLLGDNPSGLENEVEDLNLIANRYR